MPEFEFTQSEVRAYEAVYYVKAATKEEAIERMNDYDYDSQGEDEFVETMTVSTSKIKEVE